MFVCVDTCTQEKEHVCCRAVAAVTNLPGPPDGNRSKVTELWLDKHRNPASISYPVHFGNTWLFLAALGPRKKEEAKGAKGEEGREGEPQERHSDECAVREIAAGGTLREGAMEGACRRDGG